LFFGPAYFNSARGEGSHSQWEWVPMLCISLFLSLACFGPELLIFNTPEASQDVEL